MLHISHRLKHLKEMELYCEKVCQTRIVEGLKKLGNEMEAIYIQSIQVEMVKYLCTVRWKMLEEVGLLSEEVNLVHQEL